MSEETLYTAARRAIRFFNICMNKGGLVDEECELAMHTLGKMVEITRVRLKAAGLVEEPDGGLPPDELPPTPSTPAGDPPKPSSDLPKEGGEAVGPNYESGEVEGALSGGG